MTTSDLQTQNIPSTNNPQAAPTATPEASDSASFQKSAGIDALRQNREIEVAKTGQPLGPPQAPGHNIWAIIAIVVIVALALAAGAYVYRLTGKISAEKPEAPTPEDKPLKIPTVKAVSASAITAKKPVSKGKKKPSRSQRSKA